jgi:hypothetical protein
MDLEDLAPLQEALEADSPDFTAEEAASAIETISNDDFMDKAITHLREQLTAGVVQIDYQRRRFGGVNYQRVLFGESKLIFRLGWLR